MYSAYMQCFIRVYWRPFAVFWVKRDSEGHTQTPEPTLTRLARHPPTRVSAGSSVGVGSRFRTVASLPSAGGTSDLSRWREPPVSIHPGFAPAGAEHQSPQPNLVVCYTHSPLCARWFRCPCRGISFSGMSGGLRHRLTSLRPCRANNPKDGS